MKFLYHVLTDCVSNNVLADFFKENWQEVTKVSMLDYTFERQIELEILTPDSYSG